MPFDEQLAGRVRKLFGDRAHVVEKRMFGGIAFMVDGHMCCGLVGDNLMVRVGVAAFDDAIARPHARPMDFTGKPSKGMVYVSPAGLKTAAALRAWVDRGIAFVSTLPKRV